MAQTSDGEEGQDAGGADCEGKFGGPPPPRTEAQRWVLATQAVLVELNRTSHLRVGGEPRPMCSWYSSLRLRDFWGVRSPREAREQIRWLLKEGHRFDYAADTGRPADDYLAWDLVRASCVAGWSYVAYLLELEEAWSLLVESARGLQAQFNSWREVGLSYAAGKDIWGAGEDDIKALTELLIAPGGAWDLPFDIDLSGDIPAPVPDVLPEFVVGPASAGGTYATIGEALDALEKPSRIRVLAGVYEESVNLCEAVELIAEGEVIVRCNEDAPLVIESNSLVQGFQFEAGRDEDGETKQAVWLGSAYARLVDCVMRTSRCGAYAAGPRADLVLVGCRIERAGVHGVLAEADSKIVLIDCHVDSPGGAGLVAKDDVELFVERLQIAGAGASGLSLANRSVSEIVDVSIRATKGNGVDVLQSARLVAQNLVIEASAASGALFMTTSSACALHGGSITRSAGNDLGIVSGAVTVEGMALGGGTGCAVVVQNQARLVASKLTIAKTSYPSVWLMGASSTTLLHCQVQGDGESAIFADDGAGLKLVDCDVTGAGKAAVVLRGAGEASFEGGRLSGSPGVLHLDQGRQLRTRGTSFRAHGEGEAACVSVNGNAVLTVIEGRVEAEATTGLRVTAGAAVSLTGVDVSAARSTALQLEDASLRSLGGALAGRDAVSLEGAAVLETKGTRIEPPPANARELALEPAAVEPFSLALAGREGLTLLIERDQLKPVLSGVDEPHGPHILSTALAELLKDWNSGGEFRFAIVGARIELDSDSVDTVTQLASHLSAKLREPELSSVRSRITERFTVDDGDDDAEDDDDDEEDEEEDGEDDDDDAEDDDDDIPSTS